MAKATRSKIIEKAEKLLWERGYGSTSLNDVVNDAGVSKGAFFHYYPNKQAISKDVIDKYAGEQVLAKLDRAITKNPDNVKEGLFAWISDIFETAKAQDFKGGCLLGNLALEMADTNDYAREIIKGHFLDLENNLTSYTRPLQDDGKLLIEARQFARLLIASIQGTTMMSKVHKDKNRASREFLAVARLIEYAITE